MTAHVPDAVAAVIAARIARDLPQLDHHRARAVAARAAQDIATDGWHITARPAHVTGR